MHMVYRSFCSSIALHHFVALCHSFFIFCTHSLSPITLTHSLAHTQTPCHNFIFFNLFHQFWWSTRANVKNVNWQYHIDYVFILIVTVNIVWAYANDYGKQIARILLSVCVYWQLNEVNRLISKNVNQSIIIRLIANFQYSILKPAPFSIKINTRKFCHSLVFILLLPCMLVIGYVRWKADGKRVHNFHCDMCIDINVHTFNGISIPCHFHWTLEKKMQTRVSGALFSFFQSSN